jgi:hypothetical protein
LPPLVVWRTHPSWALPELALPDLSLVLASPVFLLDGASPGDQRLSLAELRALL